jgi:hypothetical protein
MILKARQNVVQCKMQRGEVDVPAFASWMRAMIGFTSSRLADETSLELFKNAQHLVANQTVRSLSHGHAANSRPQSEYPPDEIEWLLASAWDQATALYAQRAFSRAKAWFEMALSILAFSASKQQLEPEVSIARHIEPH